MGVLLQICGAFSVRSGCCPHTRWLIDNRHLLCTVVEAESRRPACQASALSWTADFSLCPRTATPTRELSGVASIRVLIPRMRARPHGPVASQAHLPTPSSRVTFQHLNFENPNIQPITEQIWKNMLKSNLFR